MPRRPRTSKPKSFLITVGKPRRRPKEFHMLEVIARSRKEARKSIFPKPDYSIIDIIRKPFKKSKKGLF